jgi:DNA helicase-2/ATP-dependent DNA helicase PcrA
MIVGSIRFPCKSAPTSISTKQFFHAARPLMSVLLDDIQRRFVEAEDGDIRLLAPAGSGKTHSLLYRCMELFGRSSGRARFLVVTFTRAARDELRARLNTTPFAEITSACDVVTLNGYGWRRVRNAFANPRLSASDFERQTLVRNQLSAAWAAVSTHAGAAFQPVTGRAGQSARYDEGARLRS